MASPAPYGPTNPVALTLAVRQFLTGSADETEFLYHIRQIGDMANLYLFGAYQALAAAGVAGCESTADVMKKICDTPLKSQQYSGILTYLTRKFGGNVHDKGIVNVTGSSIRIEDEDEFQPKDAADFSRLSSYQANGSQENAWLCYDFKDRKVIPKAYVIRSQGAGQGGYHPKSWVVEVSSDGSSWQVVDRRNNDHSLDGYHLTNLFTVSEIPSQSFRFVRLRQTGPNHDGTYHFGLSGFEIFGTLYED